MFKKTRHKAVVMTETGHARIESVLKERDGMIHTPSGIFAKDQARMFFDEGSGGLIYVFGLTHEAYVEAERLKHLERQVVLSRIFDFETKGGFTSFKELLPWLVIFAMIFFMG